MVFIRALDETAWRILLLCLLDWYWYSAGPPNMKLIVSRGSDGCSGLAIALSATVAVSVPWAGSRMYLLRYLARINFSIKNFRLCQRLVSWPWSLW